MAKAAKKDDFLSSIKSIVMGYITEIVEKTLMKNVMKYVMRIVLSVTGVFFLLLALRDFLILFAPNYIADAAIGIVLLFVAMGLKRG